MAKLLIVDDNPQNIEVLIDGLADEGYDILTASSGLASLGIAEDHLPDCILLDVDMPGLNGIEVCRRLKALPRTRPIPVIMVSALDATVLVVAGLDAGAEDYVTKPFDLRIVRARTRAALRVAKMQKELDEANARLTTTNQELEVRNRQISKYYQTAYEFVDHVSHEMRTPLQLLRDVASVMNDGLIGPVNARQHEMLRTMQSSIDDLALMADDMLDTSRMEAGLLVVRRHATTVDKIVQRFLPVLERLTSSSGVQLTLRLPDTLPEVFCDEEKIGRIIINLVANAVKYAGSGSKVVIWAQAAAGSSQVRIGVTDNGPGMDDRQLGAIFDRFRQVSTDVRANALGMGLGLNIAQVLARLHFGNISVESRIGDGSIFSFTPPVSELRLLLDQQLRYARLSKECIEFDYLLAGIGRTTDARTSNEFYEFLQSSVGNLDLVIPWEREHWLVAVESNADRPQQLVRRICDAWRDRHSCHKRPNVPDPDFRLLGKMVPQEGIETVLSWLENATCRKLVAGTT